MSVYMLLITKGSIHTPPLIFGIPPPPHLLGSPPPVSSLYMTHCQVSKGGSIPLAEYKLKKSTYRVKKYFWEKFYKSEKVPYIRKKNSIKFL